MLSFQMQRQAFVTPATKFLSGRVRTTAISGMKIRLRNDLYCVEWGVKLYSLIHPGWKSGQARIWTKNTSIDANGGEPWTSAAEPYTSWTHNAISADRENWMNGNGALTIFGIERACVCACGALAGARADWRTCWHVIWSMTLSWLQVHVHI